mgnify:CR=1 FL=1
MDATEILKSNAAAAAAADAAWVNPRDPAKAVAFCKAAFAAAWQEGALVTRHVRPVMTSDFWFPGTYVIT